MDPTRKAEEHCDIYLNHAKFIIKGKIFYISIQHIFFHNIMVLYFIEMSITILIV